MVHAYMSLLEWLSRLLRHIGKYIHAEKNGIVEHVRDTFTPIAESGQFRPLRLGQG